MSDVKTIKIDDIEYVRKDDVKKVAQKVDGMDYVIVRTYSAGVFACYLKSRDGKEAELINTRRLWYWDGAASLSQLAMEGTKNPGTCKFPCEVDSLLLTEVIEVLQCTEAARLSIKEVEIWQK